MSISVVVPAHDEERLIGRGLDAIAAAAEGVDDDVEVVVAANRCTDRTEEIARATGAVVVPTPVRCIAAVRNAGVAASTGEVVVTIDADSVMHPDALAVVARLLDGGRYVGGGTKVVPERWSPGIAATLALVTVLTSVTRLSGGMFWCRREDFDAIGGFAETMLVGEDLEFARRLRAHGKRTGRHLTMLRTAPMTSSTRKFDRYGDWHMFAMARDLPAIRRSVRGTDTEWVDRYFLDYRDAADA